jgi:hypothetical protein
LRQVAANDQPPDGSIGRKEEQQRRGDDAKPILDSKREVDFSNLLICFVCRGEFPELFNNVVEHFQ